MSGCARGIGRDSIRIRITEESGDDKGNLRKKMEIARCFADMYNKNQQNTMRWMDDV